MYTKSHTYTITLLTHTLSHTHDYFTLTSLGPLAVHHDHHHLNKNNIKHTSTHTLTHHNYSHPTPKHLKTLYIDIDAHRLCITRSSIATVSKKRKKLPSISIIITVSVSLLLFLCKTLLTPCLLLRPPTLLPCPSLLLLHHFHHLPPLLLTFSPPPPSLTLFLPSPSFLLCSHHHHLQLCSTQALRSEERRVGKSV